MLLRTNLFRLFAVVALAASSASLADQTMNDATFCSFESGCEAVTSSVYGKPLGIPLPIFGLAGFAAILGLTLVNRDSAGRIARWLAIAGAAVGISLIVVQFAVLERLCPLCLVADVCAIGLGVLAVKP